MNLFYYYLLAFTPLTMLLASMYFGYVGAGIFTFGLFVYQFYRAYLDKIRLKYKGINVSFWRLLNPFGGLRLKYSRKLYFEW